MTLTPWKATTHPVTLEDGRVLAPGDDPVDLEPSEHRNSLEDAGLLIRVALPDSGKGRAKE